MKVLSPAKLNLMLRILGKRKDGYHLLQTYFQLLDWGDEMQFIPQDNDNISIDGNFKNLNVHDNLIYKAAQLLLPFRKIKSGINIVVNKHIPQGSGLGGGSSNAGTTLKTLNQLWDCKLDNNKLSSLAVTLGADVPLFIGGQSSMATGIGDILTPLDVKDYYFVLILPTIGIATKEIFSHSDLIRNQKPIDNKDINSIKNWSNACLNVVLSSYPLMTDIYNTASQYAKIYMTGTGSTLFSCFNTEHQAQNFIQSCPHNWKTIMCRSK